MQIDENPVKVPTSTARAGADEPGQQRQQGALVRTDLHAGGPTERHGSLACRSTSTSSGGAVRSAM